MHRPLCHLGRIVVLIALTRAVAAAQAPGAGVFPVRGFGAAGDGRTLDTAAVNRAIAAAAAVGGGTVEFAAGDYLCHSIHLLSNVTLHLGPGATLVAADPPASGQPGGYDAPEPNPWDQYQDFGHTHWHNSLIWGENLENIAITGPGRIYGRGLSRGFDRVASPVEALAEHEASPPPWDGGRTAERAAPVEPRPDLVPGPFGYPNARDTLPAGVGNKTIALKNCRNVILRDITILHGGHFGILATGVDNLTIDNVVIDTNRDGMDVDACANVRIANCSVNSPWDDGICLKASHGLGVAHPTENVTITNCLVSGFDEGTLLDGTRQTHIAHRGGPVGRIKLGTEAGGGFRRVTIANCVFDHCRGLALEQVDGGVLEDVVVTNLAMRDISYAAIFLRLGARLRRPGATEPGSVRRVLIDNVVATGAGPEQGILIAGLPGHPIEDVVLSNLQLHCSGGGTAEQAAREVPEMAPDYPEPGAFGVLPAWGLFARHVANLQLRGVELRAASPDARPAIALDDAAGARFSEVRFDTFAGQPAWSLANVTGLHARDTTGLPDGDLPAVSAREAR